MQNNVFDLKRHNVSSSTMKNNTNLRPNHVNKTNTSMENTNTQNILDQPIPIIKTPVLKPTKCVTNNKI